MVRSSTPLRSKHSPNPVLKKASSNKNALFRSVFKPPRSPSIERRQNSPFKFKPIRKSPYKRPLLAPKGKLQTIREESPDAVTDLEERRHAQTTRDELANSSYYRDFSMDEMSDNDKEQSSDESDYDGWDDETTLVAKFQEKFSAPEVSSREKLAELAHDLEAPMQMRADHLKRYLAHTLAPAARKVKDAHNTLEQKVDVVFGVGVLSFDDWCKKTEQLALRDEEEIKEVYAKAQRNVTEYVKQLKEAYQNRNQLWDRLREAIDKSSARTMASMSALPSEIDEAASIIEKKAKDVGKPSGKDNKAKFLRDLLSDTRFSA